MSTILKALRRLEEQKSAARSARCATKSCSRRGAEPTQGIAVAIVAAVAFGWSRRLSRSSIACPKRHRMPKRGRSRRRRCAARAAATSRSQRSPRRSSPSPRPRRTCAASKCRRRSDPGIGTRLRDRAARVEAAAFIPAMKIDPVPDSKGVAPCDRARAARPSEPEIAEKRSSRLRRARRGPCTSSAPSGIRVRTSRRVVEIEGVTALPKCAKANASSLRVRSIEPRRCSSRRIGAVRREVGR